MVNRRRRNAIAAKIDLIEAVGKTLKKHGFAKLKINNVAQESGMDKTAIYRHFKDFDELLSAYVEKQDFWLMKLKEYGEMQIEDHRAFMKQLLIEQFNSINSNKEFQQLLVWELADKGEIASSFALKREVLAQGLLKQTEVALEDIGVNLNAVSALLISGVYYLILHQEKSTMCNLDITAKDDKEEIIKTIEWVVDVIFDKKEKADELEQVAVRALKKGMSQEDVADITGLSIDKIKELTA